MACYVGVNALKAAKFSVPCISMDLLIHSLLKVADFIVFLHLFQATKHVGLINFSVVEKVIVLLIPGDVMEMRIVWMAQMKVDVVSYCLIAPVNGSLIFDKHPSIVYEL